MYSPPKASTQDQVLALLRRGPTHLDVFCKRLGLDSRQVRNAIDGLRARRVKIKWDGPKTWRLA